AFAARHQVILWARDAQRVEDMAHRRENLRYLPDCPFPSNLRLTADFRAALAAADLAILAAPLAGLRFLLEQLKADAPALPFLWVCKGLEAGSGLLPHQVVADVMGDAACGVLTGPSFALEVARGLPTAITLASSDAAFAETTAQRLHGGNLRIYANHDLIGAEVGGAVKNVLAIATGICDGLGLGLNARAALITRGLVEITRFGEALGARRETFTGLAGMGDLILTCTGELSRNRRVGLLLAEGKALPEIAAELGHVAEGVPAAREVARRAAELGIDMPITRAVTAVLDGRITPRAAVEQLMAREAKSE
ncbi:MAG: NAD(P)-dependent glycerol-3-phosphate dehydrogenase, partial [Rhodocyclales bacterium]|nr:NAD(P)-dependent glycerol-3-phosphate dehydrogenase [Rhodocyclales bacterium]